MLDALYLFLNIKVSERNAKIHIVPASRIPLRWFYANLGVSWEAETARSSCVAP